MEFEARGTSVREYYILVAVDEMEMQLAERGAVAKLGELPGIGGFIRTLGAGTNDLSEVEIEHRQKRELGKRLQTVEQGIQELSDCDVERVSAGELVELVEEFWTGERTHYTDSEPRLHSRPVVIPDSRPTEGC